MSEIEPDVVDFLAVVAARNKTGKMADRRVANLRREIAERVESLGPAAVRHGLREAVRREIGSLPYAVACAKSFRPDVGEPVDDLPPEGMLNDLDGSLQRYRDAAASEQAESAS